MEDFVKLVGIFVLCVFVLIGLHLLAVNALTANICQRHGTITGMETRWSNFDECYVKHNGEWLRYSAYEKIITARDGLTAEKAD